MPARYCSRCKMGRAIRARIPAEAANRLKNRHQNLQPLETAAVPDATQCLRFGVRCTHHVLNFQLRRQITYTLAKVKEVNKKSKNAKKLAPYDIYLAAPDYPTKSVPDSQESVEGVQGELSLVITCVIHAFITTAATTTLYCYHHLLRLPFAATALRCYH